MFLSVLQAIVFVSCFRLTQPVYKRMDNIEVLDLAVIELGKLLEVILFFDISLFALLRFDILTIFFYSIYYM